jgi:hypothetical protein
MPLAEPAPQAATIVKLHDIRLGERSEFRPAPGLP